MVLFIVRGHALLHQIGGTPLWLRALFSSTSQNNSRTHKNLTSLFIMTSLLVNRVTFNTHHKPDCTFLKESHTIKMHHSVRHKIYLTHAFSKKLAHTFTALWILVRNHNNHALFHASQLPVRLYSQSRIFLNAATPFHVNQNTVRSWTKSRSFLRITNDGTFLIRLTRFRLGLLYSDYLDLFCFD